jgi:dTDP-4-dehydrorhamnose 3,5-epimerase-like enzyme
VRGWQGHKVEQRWLSAVSGSFEIEIVHTDFFEGSETLLKSSKFSLNALNLDILHIPPGYVTSIKALEMDSKLMLMSDYRLGEIEDEIRYPLHYKNN